MSTCERVNLYGTGVGYQKNALLLLLPSSRYPMMFLTSFQTGKGVLGAASAANITKLCCTATKDSIGARMVHCPAVIFFKFTSKNS